MSFQKTERKSSQKKSHVLQQSDRHTQEDKVLAVPEYIRIQVNCQWLAESTHLKFPL